jgi:aminomethyltransferase
MRNSDQVLTSSLHDDFAAEGAQFTIADNYEIAVSVSGLENEYRAIRERLGISDFSDIGKLRIRGEGAREFLDSVLTGNCQNMAENSMRTMLALDDDGSITAEVLVASSFDEFLLQTDRTSFAALCAMLQNTGHDGVDIKDVTENEGVLRVDGFDAAILPRQLIGLEAAGLRLMTFVECQVDGIPVTVTRLGSAGEFAFQFIASRQSLPELLSRLRKLHPEARLCGRAVFDVLHLEMRAFNRWRDLPYNEPCFSAGLHWMVDFRKPAFHGRAPLLATKGSLERRMVCVRMPHESSVPAVGTAVALEGMPIGYVANAAFSPMLDCPIALTYLATAVAVVGLGVTVEGVACRTVSAPFVETRSNTLRYP